jgi:L-2,4-diaminobutyric acid acetyltransferase
MEVIKMNQTTASRPISFQEPVPKDGSTIWELVKDCGRLDLNSAYSYLMLCEWFSDTCVAAKDGEELVGFVSGYRLPRQPDTLFVWQVVVAGGYLGQGIGLQLVQELLERQANQQVKYVIATISPSNAASIRLFTKLSEKLGTALEVTEKFPAQLFPESDQSHEAEFQYRIGPISQKL